MGFLTRLAWKNLWRHKLRTSVSISAVAVSIIVVVFTKGLVGGMVNSTFADHIQYVSGHIRITNQEYLKKERLLTLQYPVGGASGGLQAIMKELEGVSGVQRVVPRLKFRAAVSSADELVPLVGWGVEPKTETAFTDIDEQITSGRMVRRGHREVLMGEGLLEKLGLQVGEKVTLVYTNALGSLRGTTLEIVGCFATGLKMLDDAAAYIPLDQVQGMLDMPDQATEILVEVEDKGRARKVAAPITEALTAAGSADGYAVVPWQEGGGMLALMIVAERIYYVIYVMLVALASFVVINTMMMIVNERTEEIGMMSALGLHSSEVLLLFLLEGTFIGVVGSSVGALIGGLVNRILSQVGIDYSQVMEEIGAELVMRPIIYPEFTVSGMVFGFTLGAVVTAIACTIPARRAAALEPTEALREI